MTDDKQQPDTDPLHDEGGGDNGMDNENEPNFALLGIGIGVSIGAVLGIITQNLGLWMGLGAAIGVAAGSYMANARNRE